MDKKKIKRFIAREGLIYLGISFILLLLILSPLRIDAVFPQYKLTFEDGTTVDITIYPEENVNGYTVRDLNKVYQPEQILIKKRISEYVKGSSITSPLKHAEATKETQVYISEVMAKLLRLNLFILALILYLILLAFRFSIWAVRTLKEHKD